MTLFQKSNKHSLDINFSYFDGFAGWFHNLPTSVDYLFVRVRKRDKAPDLNKPAFDKETGFLLPNTKNITRDPHTARSWLETGYNVGLYGYRGPDKDRSIVLLDFDVKKGLPPDTKHGELVADYDTVLRWAIDNNAFVQETRSGGLQVFFVNDGSITNGIISVYGEHAGECRANNQYVVLSGSYVDPFTEQDRDKGKFPIKGADGYYKPIHIGVPVEITKELLPDWLQIETKEDTAAQKQAVSIEKEIVEKIQTGSRRATAYINDLGMSLDDIRARDKKLDRYLSHIEPKGFRSEADMGTTYKLWFWRFDEYTIASILQSYRDHDKMSRPDYVATMIAKARINGNRFQSRGRTEFKAEEVASAEYTDIETVYQPDLPDTDELFEKLYGDDYRYVLISGPPRKGKTRSVTNLAVSLDTGINYITNTHSIIQQFIRIREEFLNSGAGTRDKKLVWLSGKARNCKLSRETSRAYPCSSCPYYGVNDFESYQQFQNEVFWVTNQLSTITPHTVGEKNIERCPYYLIKHAEKEPMVDICCTVPYYITSKDARQRIQTREITVIDEDPTVNHFYPDCIEIASYNTRAGSFENNLADKMKKLQLIKDRVNITDGGSEKKVYSSVDKTIIEIIGQFERMNVVLEDFANTPRGEKVTVDGKPVGVTMGELETSIKSFTVNIECIETIDRPIKLKILNRVEKYERDIPKYDDESTITNLFESFLFSFEPLPLDWQGTNTTKKLYLIGDRSQIIRVPQVNKMVSIGFTNSELFIRDLQKVLPGKAIKFNVTDFSYDKNFVVIKIMGETKSDQKRLLRKFMSYSHYKNDGFGEDEKMMSSLVLTSSKDKQAKLHGRYSRQVTSIRREDIDGINRGYYTGGLMVFYTNSTISRGIDVDMFDSIFVDDTNYAMPYYESAMKVALENKNAEEFARLRTIRDSMITDEITNSILRICNIPGNHENQVKFVVITATDFEKIHQTVSAGMYTYEISDPRQFDMVFQAVLRNSRGFKREFEYIEVDNIRDGAFAEHVGGSGWEETQLEFDDMKKIPVANSPTEVDIVRKRQVWRDVDDKILQYLTSATDGGTKSRQVIIKRVQEKMKRKTPSERTIVHRLSHLSKTGKLNSSSPSKEGKVYYSLRRS